MLNRLPKYIPPFDELVSEVCPEASCEAIARALGVSVRSVRRWRSCGAPTTARLALWWLSRDGHRTWDAEMGTRSDLAFAVVTAWARGAGRWPPEPGRAAIDAEAVEAGLLSVRPGADRG